MTRIFAFAATLALSACAGRGTQPSYAAVVGMIQTDYPVLKTAAAAACATTTACTPQVQAIIAAAEKTADPLVASLTATSAPAAIAAVLTSMGDLLTVPGIPINDGTKADIALALGVVGAVVSGINI